MSSELPEYEVLIDATVGGENSNSYITEEEAQEFADSRLHISAWENATGNQKRSSLRWATARIDEMQFMGSRASNTQSLKWPRTGLLNEEGIDIPDDALPKELKRATFELAISLIGSDSVSLTGLEQFDRLKVGSIEIEPSKSVSSNLLPPSVSRLIGQWINGQVFTIRIARG